jgi:hypothetical protein
MTAAGDSDYDGVNATRRAYPPNTLACFISNWQPNS